MTEIIKIENLTKVYESFKGAGEVTALDNVNLSVSKGEFLGIMGASGSGKTTLLNILSGIDKSTSGKVLIDNQDIATMKDDKLALFRRQNIGYIFQDFNLLDSLTLKENIALPLILDKKAAKEIEQQVQELMEFFGIGELGNKYPFHISGGQKQRVAAARALVNQPAVCFADEPTGNLDSKSSSSVMNMLTQMNSERESTILMVTHDPFAASFCKKIIFIKDGKIHAELNRETCEERSYSSTKYWNSKVS